MVSEKPISVDRLRTAMETAAFLVDHHGPAFIPIFERLERELLAKQNRAGVVDRATRIAKLARSSRSSSNP